MNFPGWKGKHVKLIDPDQLKNSPGEQDHEASIEKAKKLYQEALRDLSIKVIVYQGSGTWLPYMKWLFEQAQPNMKISLVLIHAEQEVCVERALRRKGITGQDVSSDVVKKRHAQLWKGLPTLRQDPRISLFVQFNNGHTPKLDC